MVKLYAELVFLDNVAMNYIILFLTSKLASSSLSILRGMLSAGLGGGYSMLYLLSAFDFLRPVLCKILLSIAMVSIAFGGKKHMLRSLGVFYAVTFLLGGTMFGLLYFTGAGTMTGGLMLLGGFPIRIILLSAFLSILGVQLYWKWAAGRIGKEQKVRIVLEGELELDGLIDTGHRLREPISGDPVVIVDMAAIREILPPGLLEACGGNGSAEKWAQAFAVDCPENGVRLIPYHAMGQKGLLPGIRPKEFFIYHDGWKLIDHIYIALSSGSIRAESGFQALLPAKLAQY